MKKIAKRFPLSIVPKSLLGLAIFLSLSGLVRAQAQGAQVIEVTAKKYEYSSSPVHVKIGTKVQLKITATDHDHGFKIFLAQASGTYTFRCCHSCGLGHRGMKAQIVVD